MSQPTAEVRTESVYFWTTGEDMTRLARGRVLDGDPDHAARLLRSGLGMDWNQAYSVLDGSKKLVGDSRRVEDGGDGGLALVEDADSGEYKQSLKYLFAGRVKHGDKWYRPRVYVAVLGEEDARWAAKSIDRRLGEIGRFGDADLWSRFNRQRAAYYARDGEPIFILSIPGRSTQSWVIFEPVSAPPVWWTDNHYIENMSGKWQHALNEYMSAGRTLAKTGAVSVWNPPAVDLEAPLEAGTTDDAERQAARKKREAELEAEEEQRDQEYRERIDSYRQRIREQAEAGIGYFTLEVERPEGSEHPTSYQIPRAPFEVWTLQRTSARHVAPKWEAVCPFGLKLPMDVPEHSDWMVGAEPAIPFDDWYGSKDHQQALQRAVYGAQRRVQKQVAGFSCLVLCGTGYISEGKVRHPEPDEEVPAGSTIVIPHASPKYAIPAMSAGPEGLIICEQGGELSHIAVVGREQGLRLVQVPDALQRFPAGCWVSGDLDEGRVGITSRHVRGILAPPDTEETS